MIEEQQLEIEALQSIFPEEFSITDQGPPLQLSVVITGEEYQLTLDVELPETYPETVPRIEFHDITGIPESLLADLKRQLDDTAKDNVGMAMVFTLVSFAKDLLDEGQWEETLPETVILEEEEEAPKGTPVTPASFALWKAQFIKEMLLKEQSSPDYIHKQEQKNRPTGRQLFEKNRALAKSDVGMMAEDEVEVDYTLFNEEDIGFLDEEDNEVLAGLNDDD